jgi:hypothetical protein
MRLKEITTWLFILAFTWSAGLMPQFALHCQENGTGIVEFFSGLFTAGHDDHHHHHHHHADLPETAHSHGEHSPSKPGDSGHEDECPVPDGILSQANSNSSLVTVSLDWVAVNATPWEGASTSIVVETHSPTHWPPGRHSTQSLLQTYLL